MSDLIIHTQSAEETMAIGEQLADYLEAGMVIRLEGDLGAGKTTFTKGLAKGLGINRYIKSPTYMIIREYTESDLPLYHVDLYRLDENSVEDIGLDEYFYGNGVTVIEWGSVAEESMPENYLRINIETDLNDHSARKLTIKGIGNDYHTIVTQMR